MKKEIKDEFIGLIDKKIDKLKKEIHILKDPNDKRNHSEGIAQLNRLIDFHSRLKDDINKGDNFPFDELDSIYFSEVKKDVKKKLRELIKIIEELK